MDPNVVRLWPGKLFGYNFSYIESSIKRATFMEAIKTSIPMKMWDAGSRRWWIPDLYTPVAESIALSFGALAKEDLVPVAALHETLGPPRSSYGVQQARQLAADHTLLGVIVGSPLRLVEMAAMYWRVTLATMPIAIIDAQEKEAAWQRIQEHFKTAAGL